MWHEARRVEKQLRGMMVNFKRRAERRRAFYSRMKQDPVQLLRIYGHKCKIHIDAQVAAAAEHRSVMMPWQGHADNMIDRFDGRANLDIIPTAPTDSTSGPLMETDPEQNRLNYERYRTLVMIDHSGVSEEDYLQQLAAEEMIPRKDPISFQGSEKKEKSAAKASIGYSYDDSSTVATGGDDSDDSDESDAESIPSDIDVTVDVDELTKQEMQEIDNVSMNYGMAPAQFCRKLKVDKVEAEEQKKIKEEEEERALMGGRRSRKDRRSARERQRHHHIKDSPPSYARRASPTYEPYRSGSSSSSSSRSPSPENAGQVEFITEFGATDGHTKPGGSSLSRTKAEPEHERKKRRSGRSRDRSRDRSSRHRSRSRDRRRSRDRSRSRSREKRRGRSSSRDRYRRSRDRSRSSSRDRHRRRSRSRSSSRDRYREDRYRDSKESSRAKDAAKATAKLTGLNKDKKPAPSASKDKTKLTPQERMKRRMQLMLNKQLKVDRKEERIKRDVKEQERMDREDDLREMQRKWREGRRSPSPKSWSSHRRSRSRSPERSRFQGTTESPKTVPIVDFEQETRDEEVIHYVYT